MKMKMKIFLASECVFVIPGSFDRFAAPLLLNTLTEKPANEEYHTVQLLGLVLELLSFCVEHHTYHIKNCIFNKDLLRRILVLMKSTHTFLVLGALRFLRKIIALKDEFYNRRVKMLFTKSSGSALKNLQPLF